MLQRIMDYKLQTSATRASIRRKKRIIALMKQGHKPADVAVAVARSRQYVEQVYKEHLRILGASAGVSADNQNVGKSYTKKGLK
ncbi:MAG: hypothetical protein NUV74_05440 [Candidatus Brocadiaceae bacterium]|nr:hypothetical protein [Candidatus Brocadiaceae bacterium]